MLARSWSVIVLAVTSCRRLSIAPGSFTLESGTLIVIVPLWPVVTRQFAAGSWVNAGIGQGYSTADCLLGVFAGKALYRCAVERLGVNKEILSTIRIRRGWNEPLGQPDQIKVGILSGCRRERQVI